MRLELLPDIIAIQPINNDNIVGPYYHASISLNIFNYGEFSTVFNSGYLEIENEEGNIVCRPHMVGIDRKYMGADFKVKINNKDQFSGEIWLNFESIDCISMGLDEYGEPDGMYSAKAILYDTEGLKYESNKVECGIFARGQILHKVWLKKGIQNPNKRLFFRKKLF